MDTRTRVVRSSDKVLLSEPTPSIFKSKGSNRKWTLLKSQKGQFAETELVKVDSWQKSRFEWSVQFERPTWTFNLTWEILEKKNLRIVSKCHWIFSKRFWQRKYSNHIVTAGVEWFRWHFSEIQINHGCTDSWTTRKPRTSRKFWILR